MLVLSRRPGQRIVFPKLGISIEVLKLNGNVARLGITAPPDVDVHREEIHMRKSALVDDLSGADDSGSEDQGPCDLKSRILELRSKLLLLEKQLDWGTVVDSDCSPSDSGHANFGRFGLNLSNSESAVV